MPNEITTLYTIWDNHAPADEHSGFIFGETFGTTGFASSTTFIQDIYCFDGDWPQSPVGFYSCACPPFGNGNETTMFVWGSQGWTNYGAAPGEVYDWWEMGYVVEDDVIFAHLHDDYFVKIFIIDVPQHPVHLLLTELYFTSNTNVSMVLLFLQQTTRRVSTNQVYRRSNLIQ